MREGINAARPAAIARVVRHAGPRKSGAASCAGRRHFKLGETVRSLAQIRNDGTYPHRDIGEVLVQQGDVGCVREDWSFLGEVYYRVEFIGRAVVVIMRGKEMERSLSL